MKTLEITDKNMTVKTSVELVKNVIFREVEETENYDLVITECGIDSFWKQTDSKLGEIKLEANDLWVDGDNNLVNRSGVITTVKQQDEGNNQENEEENYIEINDLKKSTIENLKNEGWIGIVFINGKWGESWYAIKNHDTISELAELNEVDYNPNNAEWDSPEDLIGYPIDVDLLKDTGFDFEEENELKAKIEKEIEEGNMFAWNDGDGGLEEAIDCGNVAATYEEAANDLGIELYGDDWMNKNMGWTAGEAYRYAASQNGTAECHHTWIYDLKLYLEELL